MLSGWVESGETPNILDESAKCLLQVFPGTRTVIDDGSTAPHLIIQDYIRQQMPSAGEWHAPILFILDPAAELLEVIESLNEAIEEGDVEFPLDIQCAFAVLEATSLMSVLFQPKPLVELGRHLDEFDDLTDADLLVEKIEVADVVLLVRTQALERDIKEKVINVIEWLNPRAQTVAIEDFNESIRLPSFDYSNTISGGGWLQLIAGTHPQTDRGVGISGFSFRARRPFHPTRLLEALEYLSSQNVLRARGLIWVATRHNEAGHLLQAGRAALMANSGPWWAATPMKEWPEDPLEREEIMAQWVPPYGDRQQEFSIIGIELQELEIRRKFKQALLTDDEFELGPTAWGQWDDPLPDWSPISDIDDEDSFLN